MGFKWILLILALRDCRSHPIVQEDRTFAYTSDSDVADGSPSPPPDLEVLQSEARYVASTLLQRPSAMPTRHGESCETEGTKYHHGDKIWRPDPCETCLCLDGEIFCWWQQYDAQQLSEEALVALIKDKPEITEEQDQNLDTYHLKTNNTSINKTLGTTPPHEDILVLESFPSTQDVGETMSTSTSIDSVNSQISHFNNFSESTDSSVGDFEASENIESTSVQNRRRATDFDRSTQDISSSTIYQQQYTESDINSLSAATNDAESLIETTNDGLEPSDATVAPRSRHQVNASRTCIVMGVEYAVGAVLPGETGNCLRCVCSDATTASVAGVGMVTRPTVTTPTVTCHPHDCAPLTRKDIFEETANSF